MSEENNDDIVSYEDFSLEPSSFLNIKKGDQLKNKKVLKTKLSEIDNSLNIAEKELYLILYYSELLMDDSSDDGLFGDNSDAIDSLNDIMEKCSQISELLDEIKDIKNKL